MEYQLLDGALDSFTLVPEDVLEAFEDLSRTEARLLAFLCRYTFGEDKLWVRVTFKEFEHGLKRPNGTHRTAGTGLSAYRVKQALQSLIDKGLVEFRKDESDGGRIQTWYTVITDDDEDYRIYPDNLPDHLKDVDYYNHPDEFIRNLRRRYYR